MSTGGGRLLLRAAVESDGPAFPAEHGETSLRGPSTSITRTPNRLIKGGTLPGDIGTRLVASGPDMRDWSKTAFYYLADGALSGFREAFRVDDAQRPGGTDA